MDYYEVYRSTTSGVYGEEPYFTTKDGDATYYKNTKDLKNGVRYYYKVRGVREINGKTYYTNWSGQAYRLYSNGSTSASENSVITGRRLYQGQLGKISGLQGGLL